MERGPGVAQEGDESLSGEGSAIPDARHDRIGELFLEALERPVENRLPFLTQACVDDKLMLDEVLSLLRAHNEETDFLKSPFGSSESAPDVEQRIAADLLPDTREDLLISPGTPTESERTTAGTINSRYKLLQKIGEGGMGEVWLAEQKEPVRRRVAVKLVKAGMNSREVIARFESERQALALMDHPAIAKVLDAGATADGMPYFVMEYVAGVPITNYCDDHKLSTRERLQLFIGVCEGVHHAHQKAIIHRDLKPSNILVAEVGGRPAPKIIDFGVAKALSQKLTVDTMFTRVGAIIGTPEYMSPEQANWSHEDIDTRSDIYSLGVIFYELLAGSPPINLQKIAYDEFLRRLRDEEPSKPSTKIRTQDPAASAAVAVKRHTEPVTLAKQISGDLDAIALKTLEKNRSRRYGSASDFAADIGRFLNNEPVLAVAPSAAYRARKFASRYRGELITLGSFILVLILAAAISIWQSIRATRERDRADAAVTQAQAIADFLQIDLLAPGSTTGDNAKPDPDLKFRTVLDRAATRIAGKFAGQPVAEAATRFTIGSSYWQLGVYQEAQKHFERALELRRRTLGVEHPDTLKAMNMLGVALAEEGKLGEAAELFNQLVEVRRRVLGPDHRDTLTAMSNLGNMYDAQGKYAEAAGLDRRLLESRRRLLGPEHPDTLNSMNNLALDYKNEGKYDEAEALHSKIFEIRRRLLGPEHPDTLLTMFNLAVADDNVGKFDEARRLINQVLEIRKRTLPPNHPYIVNTLHILAFTTYLQGRYQEAEKLNQDVLEIRRRSLGPNTPKRLFR